MTPDLVHVAMVRGQWIRINREHKVHYLHARSLKRRDSSEELSTSTRVDRFREHRRVALNQQGSPLKHEYDPEANLTWRWMEVDGRWQWVEADWSLVPPRKLWGFDSDDSDDDAPDDDEVTRTAKSAENGTGHTIAKEVAAEEAPSKPVDARLDGLQEADVQPKRVSFGGFTVHEYPAHTEDEPPTVRFAEDSSLDEEESEERAQGLRFGALATIESSKETRLRRKVLRPTFEGHDCQSCIDRERSLDDQAEEKDSFGSTPIADLTKTDKPEETENSATTEGREQADFRELFDVMRENDRSEPDEQPADVTTVAASAHAPNDIKPARKTTIRFAPVTVIKESPANHLPTLQSFPDFCTASKPIFRPDHRRLMACSRAADKIWPD